MKQFDTSSPPVVITLKRKNRGMAQDRNSYQHRLDMAAQADPREGIWQGVEDARRGGLRAVRRFS